MKTIKELQSRCVALLIFCGGPACATDISGVDVQVKHWLRADGLWQYDYIIYNPNTSTAAVRSFEIDISCNLDDYGEVLPTPSRDPIYDMVPELEQYVDELRDGAYVPVEVIGNTFSYGVNSTNHASWAVKIQPGGSNNGMSLVAPTAPAWREYRIAPRPASSGDEVADSAGHGEPEEYANVNVLGVLAGPGCPGTTEPVEEARPVFKGTALPPAEFENDVLTYVQPHSSNWSTSEQTATMTILYAADLVPGTFAVTPARLANLFNPVPGTEETVTIPLQPGMNKLRLSAKASLSVGAETSSMPMAYEDRDYFAIRRNVTEPKGNAYGHEKR